MSFYRAKNITVNIACACGDTRVSIRHQHQPPEYFGDGSKYSADGRKTTRQNTYKLLAVGALNSAHVRYNPSPFPLSPLPLACIRAIVNNYSRPRVFRKCANVTHVAWIGIADRHVRRLLLTREWRHFFQLNAREKAPALFMIFSDKISVSKWRNHYYIALNVKAWKYNWFCVYKEKVKEYYVPRKNYMWYTYKYKG